MFKAFIKIFFFFLLGIALGYDWRIWQERPAIADSRTFQTEGERREHYRLLKKHGLDGDISIIYSDPLGHYYIRDGKRCAFK